ncbi:MAG: Alkyl hydroperoxide reductase/ Thiol specific antioxidant/ Mal allergen [Parcubacteria group bacterium GW2011_GWA2_47_10]|nr:MAG: Alkyl hydroperoxide reductase/ Thiol specific antioxidant/ Mal allergen [Parcubacteria group bacterium GW2011_GWA2_47_10]
MKKNNIITTIIAIAGIGLIGALVFFWGSGKKSDSSAAGNKEEENTSVNVPASIARLLDKPAPAFSLKDRNGTTFSSESLRGKKVVLFFNEGIMCYPACWNQVAYLGKDERLKMDDVVVLSVVVDPPEEWAKAVEKMPELSTATVLFDKDTSVSRAFGMLVTPSSMHYGRLPGHTYVVMDKEGIVRHVFDDPNMALHNDQLIVELQKLN